MKLTFCAGLALVLFAVGASAQPTVFTYQGQLQSSGAPAAGNYDLRFAIYDAQSAGSQVGAAITNAPVGVTNGLFTTTLDFGSSPFNGNARWLDLGVRTNGNTNQYTFLAPRQPLNTTPYAIRALNALNLVGPLPASSVTGVLAVSNLPPTVALLNTNANFSGSVSANQFNGSGAGLSNLPAANLTGLVADARLSTNVAFLNSNAVFKASITGSNFYGNGIGLTNVPGRIFVVIPTAVNIQALANFGYLATNDLTPVVVTLPDSPNIRVGETIRVAGSGAGGWVVAQNAGQSILMGNLLNVVGLTWTPRASSQNWKAVASSADGKKLAATVGVANGIFTSTDYGVNWSQSIGSPAAQSMASSGDGTKLVAGVNGGQIYTSTDSGGSWGNHAVNATWVSVASSLDGMKLVACANGAGGGIVTSTDAGGSWTTRISPANFISVASSADGTRLVAAPPGNPLRTSVDSGVTWTPHGSGLSWSSVASSADGSRLVAAVSGGQIYVSSDYGTNWIATGPTSVTWTSIASSADGARLAATYSTGLYASTDSGLTWSPRGLPGTMSWTGVAMSSDASTLAAVGAVGQIYMSSQATTTTGTAGYLTGARLAAVELEYVGGGVFIPISYVGSIQAN